MFPVADDFAAIAKRLKEIQQEVAAEATVPSNREADDVPVAGNVREEIAACG